MSGKIKLIVAERFWPKVAKTDACWIWQAGKNENHYGRIMIRGNAELAHRVAWTLQIGPIPEDFSVLHRCDNPECVNPEHLFLGTQQDNVADMISKGRNNIGSRNGASKLTAEQVIEIRRRDYSQRGSQARVAHEFGICVATMHGIIHRQIWRHV